MNYHQERTLTFIRRSSDEIELIALLTLKSSHCSDEDAYEAFSRAVTNWVNTTGEGLVAWKDSCNNMNIGDLLAGDHLQNPVLLELMRAEGLEIVGVRTSSPTTILSYDRVLVEHFEDPETSKPAERP